MQGPRQKIAMIDDHRLLRDGMAQLINTFDGFEVYLQADNGADFISQLENAEKPDIVLLDINMPVMDGFKTADWIRKNLPETRTMVLTMVDSNVAIIRMINFGARGFILKDSRPDQFRQALIEIRDIGYCLNQHVSPEMAAKMMKPGDNVLEGDLISKLSERETSFLKLVCQELTYREIADLMFVSYRTVDGYRDALFNKLGVISRVGLVIFAIQHGIADINTQDDQRT